MRRSNIQISFLMKFFPCLLLCLGGGWLTGIVTQHGVRNWYPYLVKPFGTPPDMVFPIVWSLLYSLMAVSLTLFWMSRGGQKKLPLLVFMVQLFLNFLWSGLFFYLQKPGLALIDIALLWVFIFLTIRLFWDYTRWGSYLLLPYLAWVTYAFYLNLFIWIYNS